MCDQLRVAPDHRRGLFWRAWVTIRDGWYNFQALWEGGTAARIAQPYCLALTTRKRNEDLAFYAGQAAAPAPIWKQ